ncbi:hypothetical protein [uncultured Ilumatobacter sp.]|jgi:hypothetical protein|uniref:hypothetical protein n=1 Tax=uncultured Ilumatobacter sp. TaxID=879968 RepID=UPI00374F41E0|tara:strand:- start:9 stop:1937 length:1929 start_codon:yes stop_codon:yes gene_type:complete
MSSSGLERRLKNANRQIDSSRRVADATTSFEHDDNVIRFATEHLGLDLFPRQATLLKVLTCAEHLFTDFDRSVISEWTSGYTAVDSPNGSFFEGIRGTPPDLIERMRYCRQQGQSVFRETTLVAGRRSSKTFTAAIVALWQVSELLGLQDPQDILGLPPGKQITLVAMSTTKDSTARDVFGDLAGMVRNARVFDEVLEHSSRDSIRFWTPTQLVSGAKQRGDQGLVVLSALPTTASAGRGPAIYGALIDEAAHLSGLGPTSDTTEIHRTIAPAMAQFPGSFTIMASSPWTMIGRFYEAHRAACEIDADTGQSRMLDAFTLQIPSWELYRDSQRAGEIEMWPGSPTFSCDLKPVITADSRDLGVERHRDLASYLVEYEGQWATVSDRYLSAFIVEAIFAPLGERHFEASARPTPSVESAIHIDLSLSGDNTALVLAHREIIDGGVHVIVDQIVVWRPQDYGNGQVDYDEIADTAARLAVAHDARISLDHFQSIAMIDKITARLRTAGINGLQAANYSPSVVHANHTEKLERWELTKTSAAEGRLHSPLHQLLHDELSFLRRVDHRIEAPTSGPVTTDDAADALSHVVSALANETRVANQFSGIRAAASTPTWTPNQYATDFSTARPSADRNTVARPERGRQYR